MTASQIRDIDVCVFDAYGTLFDYASAAMRCKDALGADWVGVSELWRRKQLEYTWLRSLMGRHADFWHVTGESLDYVLAVYKRQDPSLRALLMQQFLSLDCYGDVKEMLEKLRAAGMKTAILSNGTPTMLTAAVNSTGISRLLDGIYSVEKVGIFKPHPSVYQIVVDAFGVVPVHLQIL
jgi:2-haloacid dehalogenase